MTNKKPNQLTIVEAREKIISGELTITDLTKACLNKIRADDSKIQAFLNLYPKAALKKAQKYDLIFKKNPAIFEKKPLFGIPFAIKDNFCTKKMKTTASSKVLENFIPPYNATVVEKLINAGIIIVGKTNMDAWAHGSSTETSQFFPTKNPHDLTRVPGGSSGGSAAAVAADMVIAAIGSETAGSIRQPAAWCGVVGLKPTYGRVSRWGVIAMASSTDSPGPITKTVEDAGLILSIIAGKDEKDGTSSLKEKEDYYLGLKNFKPQKVTLGVAKEYFIKGMDPEVKASVKKGIEKLKVLGFKIKEVSLMDPKYSIAVYTIVQRAEVSSNLSRFDGIRFGFGREKFGQEAKKRIMLGAHVLSAGYYDQYYLKAQKVRTLIKKDFDRVFKDVDAIVAPTAPTTALKLGESKGQPMFGEMQDVLVESSSLSGLPGISVNCGWNKNKLPIGMQIFAPQFKEKLILKIANIFEKK